MPTKPFHLVRNLAFAAMALFLAQKPAQADDALSLVLGGQTPELMNTLNLTAEGAGFYKDEHLKVSLTLVKGSAEARQACSSGQYDICPIGIEPLITDYDKGIRLKLFLSRAAKFTYVYAVLKDSPIQGLSDFKGKTIGVHSSDGSTAQAATESGLSVAGLKSTDYRLVTIGKDDDAMGALSSGKVDGAALPYYEFIPYIVAGYAVSPAVMAAKSDAVKRFSRAIVKAALLIRYNPQAASRAILVALGKPFDDKDLQHKTAELNAWEAYLPAGDPDSNRIGAITESGVQTYIDLMKSAGVITDAVPASAVITADFIAPANDFDHAAFKTFAQSMH